MKGQPRISVITSSYNQGKFIRDTIESVLAQGYPNLEHIVVDGMSTDQTVEILKHYGHLIVVREPDNGQADAINKGFRIATGEIFCFLNSDDTLVGGALQRVACEIDPASGCHIVMGRCRFIDESGNAIGIEHPSEFRGFLRLLKVWKGYTIPQPAVFWTSEVWRTAGPLRESMVLDYDLFCRFAQRYKFHFIDQILANYRLQPSAKTAQLTDQDRLTQCVVVSRQYWGSPLSPRYWRLAGSLWWFQLNRVGRARRLLTRSREAWSSRQYLRVLTNFTAAGLLAPEAVFYITFYPQIRRLAGEAVTRLLTHISALGDCDDRARVYMARESPWEDGWIGPRFATSLELHGSERNIVVQGDIDLRNLPRTPILSVHMDGLELGAAKIETSGKFILTIPLHDSIQPGRYRVEVVSNTYFVAHRRFLNGDYRPLSWRLLTDNPVSCN
jgi:hypothetical protein